MIHGGFRVFTCILSLGIIIGCKKNDKQVTTVVYSPCALCNYADSLSGSYEGIYHINFSNISDSGIIELNHIFIGTGNPEIDSNRMYFELIKHFSDGSTDLKTIYLNENNIITDGFIYNSTIGFQIKLEGDSIFYQDGEPNQMGFTPYYFFNGKKIP